MTSPQALPRPFLPLTSPDVDLEAVGGKALNLTRLSRAGLPVPNGFLIPTLCYRQYLEHHDLARRIEDALTELDPSSPETLESSSATIRRAFRQAAPQPPLAYGLQIAYRWLGAGPVAVRSSATAEDLPDLSFAGQQDTFLNVIGDQALLKAVVDCWSSLWTARAIGYRIRNHIDHPSASIAVIVQKMIQSQASGVLFTANPLSGLRSESVIDATLGLGEALVGGLVEPDHYVVDRRSATIRERRLGSKALVMLADPNGGLQTRTPNAADQQALPDPAILTLARLGDQIEALYQFPQDIEWAYLPPPAAEQISLLPSADPPTTDQRNSPTSMTMDVGGLYILQSRPITSLFPLPDGLDPDPLRVLFSFGAVQGLLGPMTALGQDAIRVLFAGAGALFGLHTTYQKQGAIRIAGSRLWVDLTTILRHPLGARLLPRIFAGVESGAAPALEALMHEPNLKAGSGRMRPVTLWRMGRFVAKMLLRMLRFARHPEGQAERITQRYQAELERLKARSASARGEDPTLAHAIELFYSLRRVFVYAVPEIASAILGGMAPLYFLSRLAERLTGSHNLALEITRGMPHNVTTEMDLDLWQVAQAIQADPEARATLLGEDAARLAKDQLAGKLPTSAQQEIDRFLEQYGMRGLGEIDLGRRRWREQPTLLMQTLQSYLQIEAGALAPDAVFQRGELAALEAIGNLQAAARQTFAGGLKARLIGAAARRVRELAGLRESPKFYIIQVMGIIRCELLAAAESLVDRGVLEQRDDLFFLNLQELEALARGEDSLPYQARILLRRQEYAREERRGQVPRLLLSDGRAIYEGLTSDDEADEGSLRGAPVSPGVVEGTVRVVHDPHAADLKPGEILVCPGTDPSWTPLFLAAGGLVMEVGGMMTHGAIVAREYGIPAVVGVDRATQRLKTGDRIRLDGSRGVLEWLEGGP